MLLSCTPAYISLLKKKQVKAGYHLEALKIHIDRPLSAILTLNTISHTFGAAGVGASVVELFGDHYLAIGSVILTLTMLYWTEMLPKTIGALHWKKLAPICAQPITWLMYLTYPFVVSFNIFAQLLSRGKKEDRITEEDIKMALEAGTEAGVINAAEQDMVENIFRLGDRKVGMLMKPRVDIDWINIQDSPEKIEEMIIKSDHHRFPVCDKDIDQVLGVIHIKDFLCASLKKEPANLKKLMRPPLFVNENQQIFELLERFKITKNTFALATDEYGTIQGMITTEDILTAITNEVDSEAQQGKGIVKINQRSWVIDGSLPIDEFKEIFHFDELPNEERARYRTLSGLCMNQLGVIPRKGDRFSLKNYRFEVVAVHKRRVEKILLTTIS